MYLKIQDIQSKYKPRITGILHLGAHHGEEAADYNEAGYNNVLWIEGNPTLMPQLVSNIAHFPGHKAFNLLISDKDDLPVTFNVTEFSQSSSILELGITKQIHNTSVEEQVRLTAHRLDTFFAKNNIDAGSYNFVNIDLQGYELIALKSLGKGLDNIDWVYAEVNVRRLYKNCALLYQMDIYLLKQGFIRKEIYMTPHFWGDALYKRNRISKAGKGLRIVGIYGEEAGRQLKDLATRRLGILVRTLKKLTKKVFFKR